MRVTKIEELNLSTPGHALAALAATDPAGTAQAHQRLEAAGYHYSHDADCVSHTDDGGRHTTMGRCAVYTRLDRAIYVNALTVEALRVVNPAFPIRLV